ncbi:MAG: DoxX family protein [Planctomycetota bacterium]
MLGPLLSPLQAFAYVLLRFILGLTFAFHGIQKIFGVFGGDQPDVMSQFWIGGMIELICGFAIAVGFLTRLAAFLASGTMAVAYTQFHWKPWDNSLFDTSFFPAVNGGELALVYCLVFFYVACAGAGRYSVDAKIRQKAPNRL